MLKCAVVVLLTSTVVTSALAGNEERDAKALFRGGRQLAETGDYAGAADMFREAYARFPNPTILINLGSVLEALEKPIEAAEVYEKFLLDPNAPSGKKADVGRKLADIDSKLGRLRIEVDPPDARITLDGQPTGRSAPFALRVSPGGHAVVGEKDGFSPAVETVQIMAGQERTVTLRLRRSSEAPLAPVTPQPAASAAQPDSPEPESAGAPVEVAAAVHAEPEAPTADLSHAGQIGLVARGEVSARTKDGISSLGATYGISRFIDVGASVLIAKELGIRPGATWLFRPTAALKPGVEVGVPIFLADGTYAGLHGGVGLTWDMNRHMGALLGAAVEHFPSVPEGFNRTILVFSGGVHARAF